MQPDEQITTNKYLQFKTFLQTYTKKLRQFNFAIKAITDTDNDAIDLTNQTVTFPEEKIRTAGGVHKQILMVIHNINIELQDVIKLCEVDYGISDLVRFNAVKRNFKQPFENIKSHLQWLEALFSNTLSQNLFLLQELIIIFEFFKEFKLNFKLSDVLKATPAGWWIQSMLLCKRKPTP